MLAAEASRACNFAVPSRIVLWQNMGDLTSYSAVVAKKSGHHVLGLELGTLNWYARPLATRPPPI